MVNTMAHPRSGVRFCDIGRMDTQCENGNMAHVESTEPWGMG